MVIVEVTIDATKQKINMRTRPKLHATPVEIDLGRKLETVMQGIMKSIMEGKING